MRFIPRSPIFLGLLLAISLLAASAAAAFLNATAIVQANQRSERTHRALEQMATTLSLLIEAESGQRGYIITGDSAYLDSFSTNITALKEGLLSLRALTRDNESQQARLDEIDRLVVRRIELFEQAIDLRENGGFAAAQRLLQTNTGRSLTREIDQHVGAMMAEEEDLLALQTAALRRSARSANLFILGGSLLNIVLVCSIVFVLNREIRERRRTQSALAHESQLLHVLMDTLPDTIYFKDTASRFTRVNRSQAQLLGVADPRQTYGRTDLDFQSAELAQGFLAEEQAILQSGRAVIDRVEFNPTAAGEPRWLSTTKLPMLDQSGAITGIVGISKDVTQRVKTEAALQEAHARLSQSFAELKRQNRGMTLLNELLDLFQTCESTEEAYGLIVHWAPRLVPVELGALYMLNHSRNLVEAVANWGERRLTPREELFDPAGCWALRRGRVHWVQDPATAAVCRHVTSEAAGGYVCVPMVAQGETLGVLHLRTAFDAVEPDGEAATLDTAYPLTVSLAEHLSLALANLKLREKLSMQAIRDPLTGLFNRRYMEESLERELARAERRSTQFGLVMMDLDHFKAFNDTFGHSAGDAVLRAFGEHLRKSVRAEDIPCRYGGEEFALVLTDANLEQARGRALEVHAGAARLAIAHQGQPLGAVTVSMGLAVYPEHARTATELLRVADAALYHAKAEGRDRLVVA